MSWFKKLLPPRIKRDTGAGKKATVPEGLWVKCSSCDAVLYRADLEKNLSVCPKCSHHNRLGGRARLELLLDEETRFEIGADIYPVDSLKFKDSRKYPERLEEAQKSTGETDALVVLQGTVKSVPLVAAALEFDFMAGTMGSVVGERFAQGVEAAIEQRLAFVCFSASGGARMQEGLFSLNFKLSTG